LNGFGKKVTHEGTKIYGYFVNDKVEGPSLTTHANGDTFTGSKIKV
jgi:hypothetical protein